jgi:hypothetical protein
MEHQIRHVNGRRFLLPDGTERLVDESVLPSSPKNREVSRLIPEDNHRSESALHDHVILRKNA